MAMVINSNIQSLNAQRHLTNSLDAQNTATERLSSGKRINSAKDDAAGLAIANRMTSQVDGLNQAIRNANDGAALIQTAEGGLQEMTSILGRMRELSIQSANGTYNTGNRDTLNGEVQQLQQEINRIAETTSFNGQNILDGSLGKVDLQVGENANQTIALDIQSLKTKNLGASGADLIGTTAAAALSTGLLTITATVLEINGDLVQSLTGASSLDEMVQLLDDSVAGIKVSKFVELQADLTEGGTGAIAAGEQLTLTITDSTTAGATSVIHISDTKDLKDLVNQINEKGGSLVQASLNDDGRLVISSETAANIGIAGNQVAKAGFTARNETAQLKFDITDQSIKNINIEASTSAAGLALESGIGLNNQKDGTVTGNSAATGLLTADTLKINNITIGAGTGTSVIDTVAAINRHTADTGVVAVTGSATTGAIKLVSSDGSSIKVEAGSGATGATDEVREATLRTLTGINVMNEASSTSSTVASIDISTAAGAQRSIAILDKAIDQVSQVQGDLGAIGNRLDHTTRNLANISENASSARSQIVDADFAAESANLSRAQVLQQAGNAMLAQANSRPQQVLSLLQ